MKKTLFTALMVAMTFVALCQSNKEEIDLVQSLFGIEKKAMAAEFIKLEGAQKDAFWLAYDDYELKRKELGKRRIGLMNKYASSYTSLDDETTDKIIKEMTNLQGQTDKLIVTYYNKLKKTSGTKAAAQFYQFENYILSKIRAEVMESIPLIGEFENK